MDGALESQAAQRAPDHRGQGAQRSSTGRQASEAPPEPSLPGALPPLTAITAGQLTTERDGIAVLWMVDRMQPAPSTEEIGITFEDSLLLTSIPGWPQAPQFDQDNPRFCQLSRTVVNSAHSHLFKIDVFSDSCIHGHVALHSAHTYTVVPPSCPHLPSSE